MRNTRQPVHAALALATVTLWTMLGSAGRAMAAAAPLEPDRRATVPAASADGGFPWGPVLSVGLACLVLVALVALAVTRVAVGRRRGRAATA